MTTTNLPTRRRRMARIASLVTLAALLAAFVAACGSDDSASGGEGGDANLAFFGLAGANAYTQAAWEAAKEEADKQGASIRFFDGEFDAETQYRQVQDAIATGQYDGFLVMPNDGAGLVPVVEQAIDEGIKVAALEFAIGPDPTTLEPQVDGLTATIGYDIVSGSTSVAELIVQECKGIDPCKVALMYGDRSTLFDQIREKTTEGLLSKEPNIEVVADVDAGFLRDDGATAMQDILSANPDVNVVASPSGDQMILGAQRVLEEDGKQGVSLIGVGGAASGVEQVRKGNWAGSYIQLPGTEGREAVDLVVKAIGGEEVDPVVNLHGRAPVGAMATPESTKQAPDWQAEWDG